MPEFSNESLSKLIPLRCEGLSSFFSGVEANILAHAIKMRDAATKTRKW
jgi:hypothetical protein